MSSRRRVDYEPGMNRSVGRRDLLHGTSLPLVVVGGGVSGLAAAHFYRRPDPEVRIQIMDDHDDFGGPARRNEFRSDARRLIGHGASRSVESATGYGAVSKQLLRELTLDPALGIEVISVNRWPHGYACDHSTLFDPEYAEGDAAHERGRLPCGRAGIANSDSGGRADLGCAIDRASRAVGEPSGESVAVDAWGRDAPHAVNGRIGSGSGGG